MQTSVIHSDGSLKPIELTNTVFAHPFNESLVHQITCYYAAGARQGTHSQKTRAEVRGGGKKPWRQKGTGRARAGSIRSPLWRGGGSTFAVKPRDYSQKINRKMYRGAMRSILSSLLASKRLVIIDELRLETPKTKALIMQLKPLKVKRAIIVVEDMHEMLYLAARNLYDVMLCLPEQINPVDLIKYPNTVVTLAALKKIEDRLL